MTKQNRISTVQAGAILGCSPQAVRHAVRSGQLLDVERAPGVSGQAAGFLLDFTEVACLAAYRRLAAKDLLTRRVVPDKKKGEPTADELQAASPTLDDLMTDQLGA